ncbi:hypothetical protein HUG17_6746 [Dermatophagoides farinae]|uniref:Uncharacterized protein n=1 Tax=Dermatophagoides farinae TaxID=6954 RepID=A0A9D4P4Y5_DERFA|nr:hypothetical protein HUG17_6746 [Dermatophagoides farinae]
MKNLQKSNNQHHQTSTDYIIIGNIIDDCFECLKFYVFRLEYSLEDYQNHKIPWSYHTFDRTIWLTMNSWMNVIFIFYQFFYPNPVLLAAMKSFIQLFHFERSDLLLLFQIITFIILEYHWFILLRKILRYKFKANDQFIRYRQFDDRKFQSQYRRYLTRFIRIGKLIIKSLDITIVIALCVSGMFGLYNLHYRFWYRLMKKYDKLNYEIFILNQTISGFVFSIETISKFGIILCTLFYSKQDSMNIYNSIIVLFFLSTFLTANGLYSLLAQLPYYNQIGSREWMQWLARSQWQRYKSKSLLVAGWRPRLIGNIIQMNSFAQKMSDNRFGFTCDHSTICGEKESRMPLVYHPNSFIRINDFINDCFECFKFYAFRLEYSLDDYQNQRIPWTYHTFQRAIWLTLNSWINILFISHIVLEQSSMLTKTMKEFEKLLHSQRSDLINQFLLLTFIQTEYLWLDQFRKILSYNFNANKLFIKYNVFNDNNHHLNTRYRRHISHLIHNGNLISKILIKTMSMNAWMSGVFINYSLYSLYLNDEVSFITLITYNLLIFNTAYRIAVLISQLFDAMKYLLFIIEFFCLKFKQFIMIRLHRRRLLFWLIFMRKYNEFFREIFILNQTVSGVFFCSEMISKLAIIFCTLFFSKQNSMNIYNWIIVTFFYRPLFIPIVFIHVLLDYRNVIKLAAAN